MMLADEWHAALAASASDPGDFLDAVRSAGIVYGDRPLCTVRRPLIISRALAGQHLRLCGGLHRAVRAAVALIEGDGLDGRPDSLAARLGLPPEAIDLAAINPGYRSAAVLARLDTVFDGQRPQVVELNAEAPAGMGFSDALIDLFEQDPLLPPGLSALRTTASALRGIRAAWQERTGLASDTPPRLALVDFMDVPTRAEFLLIQARFEKLGQPCRLIDPRALHFDGETLSADGEPIDVIYRRLLVADVLARPDDCAALVEAYRAGAVCMVNSFRTALLHSKGLLALLHDPLLRDRLDDGLRSLIDAHVPWTGILGPAPGPGTPPGLRERARLQPEQWVLKPLRSHGGQGIVTGWTVSQREWEAALEAAHGHVLQRRIHAIGADFPLAAPGWPLTSLQPTLDPFLVGGRLTGFLCRLSETLGNVTAGAVQVPVFIAGGTGRGVDNQGP
jgi:hypothetical protein